MKRVSISIFIFILSTQIRLFLAMFCLSIGINLSQVDTGLRLIPMLVASVPSGFQASA